MPWFPCLGSSGLSESGNGEGGNHSGSPNPVRSTARKGWGHRRTTSHWSCCPGPGHLQLSSGLWSAPLSAAGHIAPSHFLSPPGTREGAAKPSAVATRPPRARDQERKKAGFASSLRMEPHSRSARSRKSTKFRSISRSLILCNAKTSDDGSSPDERYPDPFEVSLGQGKEGLFHSLVQLADTTSEAGPCSAPDLAPSPEATALQAAGSDRAKTCRRMFFLKVGPGPLGPRVRCWCVVLPVRVPEPLPSEGGRHTVLSPNQSKEMFEAEVPGVAAVGMAVAWAQLAVLRAPVRLPARSRRAGSLRSMPGAGVVSWASRLPRLLVSHERRDKHTVQQPSIRLINDRTAPGQSSDPVIADSWEGVPLVPLWDPALPSGACLKQ